MRQYELTYLISDNVPESEMNKVTGKVTGYIASGNGKLLKEEIWGRRKLAYPIQKLEFATYVTVNFEMPSEAIKEFEHNIKMTGKIVRHLLIVKDFGTEALILTQEDIAESEEIKEAIGGEKAFEAVEGETEESKELMAVRGEKEEQEADQPEMDHSMPAGRQEPNEPLTEQKPKEIDKAKEKIEEKLSEMDHGQNKPRKDQEQEQPIEKEKTKVKKETPKKETKEKTEEKIRPEADQPMAEKKDKKVKPEKKEKAKKEDSEADRLSKLDQELDDILGEDL